MLSFYLFRKSHEDQLEQALLATKDKIIAKPSYKRLDEMLSGGQQTSYPRSTSHASRQGDMNATTGTLGWMHTAADGNTGPFYEPGASNN